MDLPLCLLLSYPRALAHTLSQLPVFPVPRDLVKKIRDTKGTFHAKMGLIKDRNGRDLTETEDIKKRWQEYTEELYKKDLHSPDNHNGVITHLKQISWNVKSSGP